MELTATEKEVLHLLTVEFLTPKQVTLKRKTKHQATYKIIKNLKEKGMLKLGCIKVAETEGTMQPMQPNGIRLHGEQYHIIPIYKPDNWKEKIGKLIPLDGNTVQVSRDSIDIYSNQYFFGSDTIDTTTKSIHYWNRFIIRLEHELKAILMKPRVQNITRVKQEYAQIKNGLAIKCNQEAERIKIKTREDGKLWFEIDNSFNLHEAETKHPKTAQRDMQEVVEPYFNDLRDKSAYLPSDTKEMLDKLSLISKNMVEYSLATKDNVGWLAENIKLHGPAWLGMAKEAGGIRKEIKKLSALLSQKKISEWV